MDGESLDLPGKPERPQDGDCCGSGCNSCIFDVYEENLKKWECKCREMLENPSARTVGDVECEIYLSETRYKPFSMKNVVPHTPNTKIFTFEVISSDVDAVGAEDTVKPAALGLRTGQHVIMKGKTEEGSNISRAYTPIEDRPGEFDILVKLYPDGQMSRYFENLTPGDVAYFRGPYGTFTYCANTYRRVLMLCAGTGLAPMFSTAKAIVNDESDETFVRLLFCVCTVDDILLRSELATLAENWNFTVQIHISRSEKSEHGSIRYGENVRYERLDIDTLSRELGSRNGVLVLICGTEAFNTEMTEYALALGVQKSNIYVF